jgi:N-hydroxyarylamine O-acetyltransferase
MERTIDLDAYFRRIGWAGATNPDFETLAGLLDGHTARIPFENLDVLSGRPVRLDPASLEEKMVRSGRGGYCFEHATLFFHVLDALGFQTLRHAARVVLFAPPTQAPRTHMFLTVTLDGTRYVVDPGFGAQSPRVPLPLDERAAGAELPTMQRQNGSWALRVLRDGQSVSAWVSDLAEEHAVDFELANYFVSTHPASPFVNNLMLSAVTPSGRVNVMNRDVTSVAGGKPENWQLTDRSALRTLLVRHFGFDLPEVEQLRVPAIPEWV